MIQVGLLLEKYLQFAQALRGRSKRIKGKTPVTLFCPIWSYCWVQEEGSQRKPSSLAAPWKCWLPLNPCAWAGPFSWCWLAVFLDCCHHLLFRLSIVSCSSSWFKQHFMVIWEGVKCLIYSFVVLKLYTWCFMIFAWPLSQLGIRTASRVPFGGVHVPV